MKKEDIDEAKIVSQPIRLPKGKYPKDLLNKLHNLTGPNYGTNLISKSKYTVRGSFIGLAVGAGIAMYFKKSIIGGAVLGGMGGTFVGYQIGNYIQKQQDKLNQEQEKSE